MIRGLAQQAGCAAAAGVDGNDLTHLNMVVEKWGASGALELEVVRDDATAFELGQIQKVERRDARCHAIGRHARQLTALERELHEVQALDDVEGESRIGARIAREGGKIMFVVMADLADTVAHFAGDSLAFAEDFARDGIERVIVHAHESSA